MCLFQKKKILVYRFYPLYNRNSFFFQNLAISDLLFVTICIPAAATAYTGNWPFGDIFCRISQYMIHVTCYASVITLILLSLDRFLAVVYPVKSISWRTVCNTTIVILTSWFFILTLCTPILFFYNTRDVPYQGENRTLCRFVKIKK